MTLGELKEQAKADFFDAYNRLRTYGLDVYDECGTPIHIDKAIIDKEE